MSIQPTTLSKPSFLKAPRDAVYNILAFEPSSALTLAVACRAFTPVANFFMLANTSVILKEHRSRDSGSVLSKNINNELGKGYAKNLISGNVDYRSCVIFHRSIGNRIRIMNFTCPSLILTPVELCKANNYFDERLIREGMIAIGANQIETLDLNTLNIEVLEYTLSYNDAARFITLVKARQNEIRMPMITD